MNIILESVEFTTPLDQFEIRDYISIDLPILGNLHISLTNIALYLIISFFILIILLGITNKFPKFIHSS
jgi:F-type H+-transporting ATPase subunit a